MMKKQNHAAPAAAAKPQATAGAVRVLRRIYAENGRNYRNSYLLVIGCLLTIGVTTGFAAWIMRDVIDQIFYHQRADMIAIIAGTVGGIFVLRAIAMYLQATTLARIGNDLVARYQARIHEKLLRLDVSFFSEARSGRLAAQIGENVGSIRDVLSLVLTSLLRDLVALVGLVFVMVVQDPKMSFIALVTAPALGFMSAWLSRRARVAIRESVGLNARVIGSIQESVQGVTVVKAFTMEQLLGKRLEGLIDNARQKSNRVSAISEQMIPFAELMAGVAIASVIAYGGYRAIYEQQPPGAMFAFITALLLAYDPARRLSQLKVALERAVVNAEMIYQILDMPERQRDKPDAQPLAVSRADITFRNVNFSYGDGAKVLHDLSFEAPGNKTTAIVGPSGAGKSTIIALIQRFYDADSGSVLIDGQDISTVTLASLRGQIAYVSQQPYLFEGSIRDNIRFGRPDATDEEVEAAARKANAHDFILAQAKGYDTQVGENGVTLSGGQRQRISIARAIVRNAPILLLDEATSALDNESEKLVQLALDEVMEGRTTVVIAHRLSTIVNADQIIVMDNGRVVETGTHRELSQRDGGLYAKLNMLGMGGGGKQVDPDTGSVKVAEAIRPGKRGKTGVRP